MKSTPRTLTATLLLLLAALTAPQCSREPVTVSSPVASVDVYDTDGNPEQSDDTTCYSDNPMAELRWLGQIASRSLDDTVVRIAIYRTVDLDGRHRIIVADGRRYPFDSVSLHDYCGKLIARSAFETTALVGARIDPSAMECLFQNYTHPTGDGICHVADPLADMPWLAYLAESYSQSQVHCMLYSCQFEHLEEISDGFLIDRCANCAESTLELYDCLGNELAWFASADGFSGNDSYRIMDGTVKLLYTNH